MNHVEIGWTNERIERELKELEKLRSERANLNCNGQNMVTLFCNTRRVDLMEVSRETYWQAKQRRGMEMIALGLIKWYDAEIDKQVELIQTLHHKLAKEVHS